MESFKTDSAKKPQKKKIRRLVNIVESYPARKSVIPSFIHLKLVSLFLITGLLLTNASQIYESFMVNFEKQISTLYSSSHYCTKELNVSELATQLKEEVLDQNEAMEDIQELLLRRSPILALALYGASGSGKTLTSSVIMDNFQWPENLQHLVWSIHLQTSKMGLLDSIEDYFKHQHPDDRRTMEISLGLSECGINLIVIE